MPEDEFDPSKPLPKDDEEDVQREFRARERLKYLQLEAEKKRGPAPTPKRKGVFSGRD